MDPYLWKEDDWEDANKENVRSYDRYKRRICAKKEEDISIVKRGEVYEFINK